MRSTADLNMLLLRRHWIIFSKPKPYILLDTALLINYISRPRMMTWLRENWRLYHIRCEIRSEIKGIGNVANYWVSSWDSWLLLSYLSLILRVFLLAKIVRLVMHNNREFKQRRRRRFINGKKKKKPWNWMWLFSYPKFQVVFVHILDEFSWMMFSQRKRVVTA